MPSVRSLSDRVRARFERHCLALAVYHEARGEEPDGQRAVAQVVLNRKRSRAFPASICGVVYQNARRRNRCQFSFACDNRSDHPREKAAWQKAQAIAGEVMCRDCRTEEAAKHGTGLPPVAHATHYHALTVSPGWAKRLRRIDRIGGHIFYTCENTISRMEPPSDVLRLTATVPDP
ncbi:cell wall hydrolase [Nitratireductor sp. GCM10026969]|uniref:cell wall hydrolase n=1 Tax=Nitratireductor sp. GCM10026969 TaxID=3252645 RepID=UPI00361CDCA5